MSAGTRDAQCLHDVDVASASGSCRALSEKQVMSVSGSLLAGAVKPSLVVFKHGTSGEVNTHTKASRTVFRIHVWFESTSYLNVNTGPD